MKKQLYFVILLSIIITVVGCQTSIGEKENTVNNLANIEAIHDEELKAIDYYPFVENRIYDYEGIGNEYAEQKTFVEFTDKNKAQIKIINPGTNLIKIVEYDEGALVETYSEGEFYHIENMLNTKGDKEDIILKEPIVVGNSWLTKDGYTKEITNLDVLIETPYRKFEALEVTTTFDDGSFLKEYFGKNVGLVARIYDYKEYQVKTLLKTIEEKPLEHNSQFFYPLFSDTKSVFVDGKILFYTNGRIESLFEEKLKNPPSDDLIAPLLDDMKINSIHFDRNNNWMVKVDFSDEFLKGMNSGTALEYEILKCIVNTFGKFYDTDKVYISINGRPYESGHFALHDDEGFLVDTEGIEIFKIK